MAAPPGNGQPAIAQAQAMPMGGQPAVAQAMPMGGQPAVAQAMPMGGAQPGYGQPMAQAMPM
eukprot:COSAG05_NODE_12373_length_470_cov_1.331536_1_plen_61_part_10